MLQCVNTRGRLGEAWACLGRLWGGLRGLGGRLLQDMTREMSVTCETTLQALWQFRMVGALLDLLSSSLPPNSPPCPPPSFLSWMPLGHAWGMPLLQGHEPLPCPHAHMRARLHGMPHPACRKPRRTHLFTPCPLLCSVASLAMPLACVNLAATGPPPPPALDQPWT